MELRFDRNMDVVVIDAIARLVSQSTQGISAGPGFTRVIMDNPGPEDLAVMQSAGEQFDALVVTVSESVVATDVETVISAEVASDTVRWLIVDADGVIVGSGDADVVDGSVTLEFSTAVSGVYDIWVVRNGGDYRSGSVRVTVTEAE